MCKKPVALIIMDGFGYNADDYGNAIAAAKKPNIDRYMQGPHTYIGASGLDVGLPDGQMGNSEVGHTNIGAGRIVYQMLVKISKSIKDGDFFENAALKSAMENCIEKNSSLHLMGLLSPGGVHSHMEHLYGLIEMAKKNGIEKVYDDMNDMFYDDNVDVIYITSPHNTHIDFIMKALENGKHILCEKSITLNSIEL